MRVLYFEFDIGIGGEIFNIPKLYRYLYVPENMACVRMDNGSISKDYGLAEIADDILNGRVEAQRHKAQMLTYDVSTIEELATLVTKKN